jgi:hypothetical protein
LQLARNVQTGHADAVSRFWSDGVARGGPIVEPMPQASPGSNVDLLVTFLWRETYETHNVLLLWPPAVYSARDFYMTRLPGTDVWYKTIRVRRGSRFSFQLSPNDARGGDVDHKPTTGRHQAR